MKTIQHTLWLCLLGAMSCLTANAQQLHSTKVLHKGGGSTQNNTHAGHQCGYGDVIAEMLTHNPNYLQELQLAQQAAEIISSLPADLSRTPNAVIEVPVVFHVIHSGEAVGSGRNISTARITGQLEVINADFRGQNTNWTSGTPAVFQSLRADVEVHFCLAKTDPTGAVTTGIHRVNMTDPVATTSDAVGANDTNTRIKAATKWDPTKYLNVYVLAIPGTNSNGGTIGYSYVPTTGVVGNTIDGVVLDYRWTGKTGQSGLSGGGRSLTHEIGHYLGLSHIWADYQNVGGCSNDDGIADTPMQFGPTANNATFNCALGVPPTSCGSQDMYVNYMDYLNDDACYTMYSSGQKAVMQAVLNGTAAQYGLSSRLALKNSGLTQCSACTMTVTATKTDQTCAVFGTATASAVNAPAGAVTYAWSNNATTANTTGLVGGVYTVTATGTGGCIASTSVTVINTCASRCDSISNFNLAIDSARIYSAGTGNGFVSGNNTYGDLAKADYFDFSTSANTHLKGFYIGFGYAKDAAPVTNVNLRVWNANGTSGAPNTVLATVSASLTTIKNSVAAQNYLQYFNLNTPLTLPAGKKVYIGVELPTATGDTLVLITNQVGSEAAGQGHAWEKASDGTWHAYTDATAGWGIELSHLIVAVLGTQPNAIITPTSLTVACNTPTTFSSSTSTNTTGYAWSAIASGTNVATVATPNAASTSISFSAAGTYTVLMVGTNDCMVDTSNYVTVTVTCATCTLALTASATATTCGLSNGTATVVASGGTAPYTYLWSSGGTTAGITARAAGTYTVTVTGGANCTRTASVVIATSTALTATTSSTPTTCGLANGSATAATNGGANSTYAWSNGGTTATIGSLAANTYTVTVSTGTNCTRSATVVVATSATLTATTAGTPTTCGNANGTATLTTNGGANSSYTWSNGATTATLSNLAAGTYTVTVTSGANCTRTATLSIATSTALTATANGTATTCGNANGGAVATSNGGANTTYGWSNGATTAAITNVASGIYTVTATSAAGCTRTATVNVASSTALTALTAVSSTSCGLSNGSISITGNGGANTTYGWSNGANTATISNLAAGIYTATVTGGNGCTNVVSGTVGTSTTLTATAAGTPTTCASSNGSAVATSTGGANATYAWSNGTTTATIDNLAPGTYTVTVSTGATCSTTATAVVAPSTAVNVAVTTTNTTSGGSTGTATAVGSGSTPPYTYVWSNGGSGATITGLNTGTYTVTISSSVGCTATASGVVSIVNALLEIGGFTNFKVFPNPVSHNLMLLGDFAQSTTAQIVVTDALGQSMYSTTLPNTQHLNHLISFDNIAEGVYFVSIRTDSGTLTRKVISVK